MGVARAFGLEEKEILHKIEDIGGRGVDKMGTHEERLHKARNE